MALRGGGRWALRASALRGGGGRRNGGRVADTPQHGALRAALRKVPRGRPGSRRGLPAALPRLLRAACLHCVAPCFTLKVGWWDCEDFCEWGWAAVLPVRGGGGGSTSGVLVELGQPEWDMKVRGHRAEERSVPSQLLQSTG